MLSRVRYGQDVGEFVFSVDPGEVTGWCAVCVPWERLLREGVIASVKKAAEKGMIWFGEVDSERGVHDPECMGEIKATIDIVGKMIKIQDEVNKKTAGAVSRINSLVIEDFILREHSMDRNLLSPVRLTSRLELAVHLSPHLKPCLSYQSPSDAKNVVTDDRLKRWDLYKAGSRHARDALRHAILHLRKVTP